MNSFTSLSPPRYSILSLTSTLFDGVPRRVLRNQHSFADDSPCHHPGGIEALHRVGPSMGPQDIIQWTYDATSGTLTPQWINTDGSSPHEEFFTQDIIFYVGGNKNAFHSKYPDDPVITIKFKFVLT